MSCFKVAEYHKKVIYVLYFYDFATDSRFGETQYCEEHAMDALHYFRGKMADAKMKGLVKDYSLRDIRISAAPKKYQDEV